MTRGLVLFVAALIAGGAFAQEQSSQTDDPGSFEIEPPLLIPNRSEEPLPETNGKLEPDADIARLEKKLERAKRSAVGIERLCRIGALAKVEVEQRTLRVVRLECDLANAQLALAKSNLSELESQPANTEDARQNLEAAKSTLARAIETAHAARAKLARADLDAAMANVNRQRKLLALGSARKSDVARAEQKVVELKQASP